MGVQVHQCKGRHPMNSRKFLTASILAGAIMSLVASAPSLGETTSTAGTVTTYSEVMRDGEPCETGATDMCKPGQPCFARIVIEGQTALALYEAMTLHASKYNDAAGSEYFGTKSDAMTCWQEGGGKYSCYIGYDAVTNELSEAKTCHQE